MSGTELHVSEIFYSIQGEGTRAGLPCAFVRLAGCDLRCRYCDTAYAWGEGPGRDIERIIAEVTDFGCDLVEVTGGEPLMQANVHQLMARLCDLGKTVLLETSGAYDISTCDRRVVRIMDLKTPGSGEAERNLWPNIEHLTKRDEVKLVLCSRQDYDWARAVIGEHRLEKRVAAVLLSAVHETPPGKDLPGATGLSLNDLAQWVLQDRLPVRVQTQLHKLIWEPDARGV